MSHAILIETPFASATQTAKALGVSTSRKRQLAKMLNFKTASKRAEKSAKMNAKRRLSSKGHASKKTRS